jgi:thiol-disulfide isomerase/thioredoxin
MAEGGLDRGEQVLNSYRSIHGNVPEALEALSWLARGALMAQRFDQANRYAAEAHGLAAKAFAASASADSHTTSALESAIEVFAGSLVEQGGRSDAILFLVEQASTYRGTPIAASIQDNLALFTLEGKPAPALEAGVSIGPRATSEPNRPRQPTLLFFWAHWCAECKAESPVIARIAETYRPRGLSVVAPTRRYGYVEGGRQAPPERELRYIVKVRDTFYPFLKKSWAPVSDANYRAYGVAAVPMHVLVDRDGVVRMYRPGRIGEAELEAAVSRVVDGR